MKKQLSIIGLILIILASSLVTVATPRVRGNGNVVKEERNVSTFTGIEVGSAFKVYIKQGSKQLVVVETDDNILDQIKTSVSGNTLRVETKGNITNPTQMNLYITVNKLVSLDVSGAAKIFMESAFDSGKEMEIETSGASSIKDANFKANTIDIDASGASKVEGKINCSNLIIDASGAANITLEGTANNKDIDASGASKVNVKSVNSKKTIIEASGAAKVVTAKGEIIEIDKSGAASVKTE